MTDRNLNIAFAAWLVVSVSTLLTGAFLDNAIVAWTGFWILVTPFLLIGAGFVTIMVVGSVLQLIDDIRYGTC